MSPWAAPTLYHHIYSCSRPCATVTTSGRNSTARVRVMRSVQPAKCFCLLSSCNAVKPVQLWLDGPGPSARLDWGHRARSPPCALCRWVQSLSRGAVCDLLDETGTAPTHRYITSRPPPQRAPSTIHRRRTRSSRVAHQSPIRAPWLDPALGTRDTDPGTARKARKGRLVEMNSYMDSNNRPPRSLRLNRYRLVNSTPSTSFRVIARAS